MILMCRPGLWAPCLQFFQSNYTTLLLPQRYLIVNISKSVLTFFLLKSVLFKCFFFQEVTSRSVHLDHCTELGLFLQLHLSVIPHPSHPDNFCWYFKSYPRTLDLLHKLSHEKFMSFSPKLYSCEPLLETKQNKTKQHFDVVLIMKRSVCTLFCFHLFPSIFHIFQDSIMSTSLPKSL